MALHRAVETRKSPWQIHDDLSALTYSDRPWLDLDPVDESSSPPLFENPIQKLSNEDKASLLRLGETDTRALSTVMFAFVRVSDHLPHLVDSTNSIATNIQSKAKQTKRALVAYERRIHELEEQAQPYGYTLRAASKAAFLLFLDRMPQIRQAGLVLMENGNLRAIWKGENGAHLGLQFISPESIQYVIFSRRRYESFISRVAGRDTIDGIIGQIDVFDLHAMLSR